MMRKIIISMFVLSCGMSQAFDLKNCADNAKTTSDTKHCISIAIDQADKELNATYQALMQAKSTGFSKETLQKAQHAWIQFRDLNCSVLNQGTISQELNMNCILETTKARTQELKELEKYL